MYRMVVILIFIVFIPIYLTKAAEVHPVADKELDNVYAQGLNIINGVSGDIVESTLGNIVQNINIRDFIDMSGSVLISDNAQQNAWNPVNASNSAVNNSYNIFIIIESSLTNPTFNINTILNAINGSTLP